MYKNLSLKHLINLVAAPTATPGGGSVAALSGSFGAALSTMVTKLSYHKHKKNKRHLKLLDTYTHRFNKSYHDLITLAYRDAQAYEKVRRNFKTKHRLTALRQATRTPYQVMQQAVNNLILINQLTNLINPKISSDLGVAAILCKASLESADLNVQINLRGIPKNRWVCRTEKYRKALLKKGSGLYKNIVKKLSSRI